jgi:hypothetical protein
MLAQSAAVLNQGRVDGPWASHGLEIEAAGHDGRYPSTITASERVLSSLSFSSGA